MAKIIHIASDEKFINNAYWQFNTIYPGENIFYLLVDDLKNPLKHVNLEKNMFLIQNTVDTLKNLSSKFDEAGLICFHGLNYYGSIVLNNTPSKYKSMWIVWGVEVYGNPYFFKNNELVGLKTKNRFLDKSSKDKIKIISKNLFRNTAYKLKYNTLSPSKEITKAINKANYCGVLYEEEFNLIKRKIKNDLKQIIYTYYPIEKMVANVASRVKENNILLGNSASYTNNHLEVFGILKNFQLEDIKVITPLSYGDQNYKLEIIKTGQSILKDNFVPLTDFLALHEYNKYLEQCGIVIMNHYRQQAVGNVLTMLWMGAKVYLDERNSLYPYLKRLGIHIYSITKEFIPDNPESLKLLTEEQQEDNRSLLKAEIGQEVLLNKLKLQLGQIL